VLIRDPANIDEVTAGDETLLKELLNPRKDALAIRYSLAVARLGPGETSLLHRLKNSEVYYILGGRGEMIVEGERKKVEPGFVIYVPPGARQKIKNTGDDDLAFLCIVDPSWKEEDEEVLE